MTSSATTSVTEEIKGGETSVPYIIFQMSLDFAHGHTAGTAQDIVIEAVTAGLMLGDQLRLEAALAVAGYLDGYSS